MVYHYRGATREFLRGGDTNFGLIYRVRFFVQYVKFGIYIVKLFSQL